MRLQTTGPRLTTLSLTPTSNDNTILWAVTLSVMLHIFIAYVVPKLDFERMEHKLTMTVELAPPKPAEVAPPTPVVVPPEPQPLTPPPPPPPTKQPKTVTKSELPKLPVKPSEFTEPAATEAPAEEPAKPAVTPAPPAREEPSPAPAAAPALAVSEPPKPAAPTPRESSDERNQYGALLTQQINKYKMYPRIAVMRNWEGDVILELQLDANGNLTSSRIYKSSKIESLDNQALEMVKKASPFPLPPPSLRGRSFSIMVPVSFRLDQ